MLKKYSTAERLIFTLIIFFCFFFLLIDYLSPLGIEIGVFYTIPVILTSLIFKNKKTTIIQMWICIGFVIVGYFISGSGIFGKYSIINRMISIAAVLMIGIIGVQLIGFIRKIENLDDISRTAFEASPNGMLMINSDGDILLVNQQICKIFGYEKDELIGEKIELLVPDEIKKDHPMLRNNYLKNPEPRGMGTGRDLFGKRKDGKMIPVEIGLRPLVTREGRFVVSSIADISIRKKMERSLVSHQNELMKINQQLDEFAYIISHDLKAPLRGIAQVSDWIYEDYFDLIDNEGKNALKALKNRASRMNNMIEGILKYSRIGKYEENMEIVDLQKLVVETIDLLNIHEKHSVEIIDQLPVVNGHSVQLQQVFQNLISNALKYCDKDICRIKIYCKEEKKHFHFTIADNGPGIEEENFERIFKLFQTLNVKDKVESTGLGLTITKKIVEIHGGKIWVKSKDGKGSQFHFTLFKE